MSVDRHRNVFVYYRGPTARLMSATDAHRQVEDNVTKALVNTLEHSEPGVARSFCARFAPTLDGLWPDSAPAADFFLQGGPNAIPTGRRVLLGICIDGTDDGSAPDDSDSRIDGAILTPAGDLLAIETKVVEHLDRGQLERHAERWAIDPADIVQARWEDVWLWAVAERDDATEPVSRFLLSQLAAYLEDLGFSRWAGFRAADFAQFDEWSWDYQPILRARMRGVWEQALTRMAPADALLLGRPHTGKFPQGSTVVWSQTNRDDHGINLTLELNPAELQFNIVGWNADQAPLVERWLLEHPHDLDDLTVVAHERRASSSAAGKPYWRRETWQVAATFSPDQVRAGDFASFVDTWNRTADRPWTLLGYHLRRSWPADEVLRLGDALGDQIAELATRSLPILRAVNGPAWTAGRAETAPAAT